MIEIILNYIWLLPLATASILNSIMDTLAHHFPTSIFSKWNELFWNAQKSGNNKYINNDPAQGRKYWTILGFKINKFSFLSDGWHPTKSLMLFFLFVAINRHKEVVKWTEYDWLNNFIECCIYGLAWCQSFNLFYNKILKR